MGGEAGCCVNKKQEQENQVAKVRRMEEEISQLEFTRPFTRSAFMTAVSLPEGKKCQWAK